MFSNRLFTLVVLVCAGHLSGAAETKGKIPPNVLFAVADDWGYGHAGALGCSWVKTPAFDRVARQGLLFTSAYTPNAKCAPSRACMLTGRNSWQLEAAANHICYFPPKFKTFMEALGENGWFVGHTAKGWAPGVATNVAGENRLLTGPAFNQRKAKPPAQRIANNDYAANFTAFLDAAPPDKPWCFWYGSFEPHRAYEYGAGVTNGGKRLAQIDRVPAFLPDNEKVRNDLLDYAFEVEHFDRHLGRMLNRLAERGQLTNTLVIVTSDNGPPFPRMKSQAYEMSNHLPLAMMWPGGMIKPGRVIEDFISFVDFAPTVMDLAGVPWARTGMAPAAGRSLLKYFATDRAGRIDPDRDYVLIGKERHDVGRPHDWGYPIRGIVTRDYLYLRNYEPDRWPAGNPETGYLTTDGSPAKTEILNERRAAGQSRLWSLCFGKRPAEEMYDVARNPDCLANLAADPAFTGAKRRLAEKMTKAFTAENDPRMRGEGAVFEQYPYAWEAQRNFYERHARGEKIEANWVAPTDFEPEPLKE